MQTIEYFKQQAKNLHKDFKTQKPYFDSELERDLFEYSPTFFDIDPLITDFDINEDKFTLMNAQHIIAKLAGFNKWPDMVKASDWAVELGKLLFDNMHKIRPEDWEYYILDVESQNNVFFTDEGKFDIFKQVFADVEGHETTGWDYRLIRYIEPLEKVKKIKPRKKKKKKAVEIIALPMKGIRLKKFIEVANWKFEDLMETMEPEHPEVIRRLWNAEAYVNQVITPDKLPIDRNYALSLVEAFLIHHFIDLDSSGDNVDTK
mgnify:CR=1 FL=1